MNGPVYRLVGNILGGIGALCAFLGGWFYCASAYGFLFGFGLGWLPSAILAAIVFGVLRYLWPLALLGVLLLVRTIAQH